MQVGVVPSGDRGSGWAAVSSAGMECWAGQHHPCLWEGRVGVEEWVVAVVVVRGGRAEVADVGVLALEVGAMAAVVVVLRGGTDKGDSPRCRL